MHGRSGRPWWPLAALLLALPGASARAREGPRLIGQVTVHEDGFYQVPAARLRALGARSPAHVRVLRGGRPVPVLPDGPAGALVFLAADVARDSSARAVYQLRTEDDPVPRGWAPGPVPAREFTVAVPQPRLLDQDRVHGALAAARREVYAQDAPTWFYAVIEPGAGVSLPLTALRARAGTDQTLLAKVYTNRRGAVAVTADWGGLDLGRAEVESAVGGSVLCWRVPAAHVPRDSVLVILRDVSPEPPPAPDRDVSALRGALWVDAIGLSGQVDVLPASADVQVYAVEANGSWVPSDAVRAGREGRGACAALVAPDGRALGTPQTTKAGALAWGDVPPGSLLYVAARARVVEASPAAALPDPGRDARHAQHVILAVPELVEAATLLAQHRTRTGTPSVVIPVTDVYARFGWGEASWEAIRLFLEALTARPDDPLRYVVLAGPASANRTDLRAHVTIPTPMARTMYNGATSADRLYALPADGSATGGPSIGRIPFGRAETMRAYVQRLIRYETKPPPHATRRLLRFITSEGRFGAFLDGLIENLFRDVITSDVSPAYDVEVTFASRTSPFLWPPAEFNDKVIAGLNDGALFFTYVGHGFKLGFDDLHVGEQVYRILHVRDVERVAVTGTPPTMFVLACTTALFDHDGGGDGVGQALLKRPAGPVAYWGATRICHPAYNALVGQAIARLIARQASASEAVRLGDILDRARDEVIAPTRQSVRDAMRRQGIRLLAKGAKLEDLILEGAQMYTLLGDPALRLALPGGELPVTASLDAETDEVVASIAPVLPAGTTLHVSLELPRNRNASDPTPVPDPGDPASAAAVRAKHRAMNEWALVRKELAATTSALEVRFALDGRPAQGLIVKAWAIAGEEVFQGAAVLP